MSFHWRKSTEAKAPKTPSTPSATFLQATAGAPSVYKRSRFADAAHLKDRLSKVDMANPYLLTGAALSAVAALLHIGCIVFGAAWYRFFGAGERMAQLSAEGNPLPAIITSGIAVVLAAWSLYALSGAGIIPRLPLIRVALCVIGGVYVLRGLAGFVLAIAAPGERSVAFWCLSSMICLGIGTLYLIGTRQVWSVISRGAA